MKKMLFRLDDVKKSSFETKNSLMMLATVVNDDIIYDLFNEMKNIENTGGNVVRLSNKLFVYIKSGEIDGELYIHFPKTMKYYMEV